jgi:hypothetical protein
LATTTLTRGTTLPDSAAKADFHNLVDTATGSTTGIVNADCASGMALVDSKLAQITTASKVSGAAITGTIVTTKGADIASATTTDIGAATGNLLDVTGTTTITALGTVAAGALRIVRFTGALILTHHSTSLILPTGANITTVAGDTATFESLGSGNWVCLSYQRKDGTSLAAATAANALTGSVIQTLNNISTTPGTNTSATTLDDNPFTTSEGAEVLTKAITPNSTDNYLHITGVVSGSATGTCSLIVGLFSDKADYGTAANAIAIYSQYVAADTNIMSVPINFFVKVATVSATTFSVRYSTNGTNSYVNRTQDNATGMWDTKITSSMTIQEIKA